MRTEEPPVPIRPLPPPSFRVRDRELPQRLLGALLWVALFVILWKVGSQ